MVKTVFFDPLCPFAWRGLQLLNALKIEFDARAYSLHQGNHAANTVLNRGEPVWKIAEIPLEELTDVQRTSLDSFIALAAAKHQGVTKHRHFALELMRAKHQGKLEFNSEVFESAAQKAGLNLEQFKSDVADTDARRHEIAKDLDAADEIAVFGTPTIVLESGHAAYFRFANLPTDFDAQQQLWNLYVGVLENSAKIETIKRPRKVVTPNSVYQAKN
jgi:predicted DsbA family dithiol-disulfide isomerase